MRYDNEDHYFDYKVDCKLPHDDVMDDPQALARLSGPCVIIKKGVDKDEQDKV